MIVTAATAGTQPEQDDALAVQDAGRQPDAAEREEGDVGEAGDQEERDRALRDVVDAGARRGAGSTRRAPARPRRRPTNSELAASSESPISVLVRQLIRSQKTPRNTIT